MLLAGRCLAGSCQEGQACGTVARWELLVGSCQEGQARGTVARCELLAGSCQEGQARGMVARWELPGCQQQSSNRRLETATTSIIGVLAEDGRPHRTWCGALPMALPNMARMTAMLGGNDIDEDSLDDRGRAKPHA